MRTMTIKEMFKKIENYNEIAEMVNTEKLRIHVTVGYETNCFDDFKSFRKFTKREYANGLVKILTEYQEFTFGETQKLAFTCYGCEITEDVEINAYSC